MTKKTPKRAKKMAKKLPKNCQKMTEMFNFSDQFIILQIQEEEQAPLEQPWGPTPQA